MVFRGHLRFLHPHQSEKDVLLCRMVIEIDFCRCLSCHTSELIFSRFRLHGGQHSIAKGSQTDACHKTDTCGCGARKRVIWRPLAVGAECGVQRSCWDRACTACASGPILRLTSERNRPLCLLLTLARTSCRRPVLTAAVRHVTRIKLRPGKNGAGAEKSDGLHVRTHALAAEGRRGGDVA